jgi:hypothetical protein
MDHSLINPNQLRHFGVMMCDNPFDNNHPLMIQEHHDAVSILLQLKVTPVYFKSHTPTLDELEKSCHIVLTSDNLWNPGTVELGCSEVTITGDIHFTNEALTEEDAF